MFPWDQTPFLVLVTIYIKQGKNKALHDEVIELEFSQKNTCLDCDGDSTMGGLCGCGYSPRKI